MRGLGRRVVRDKPLRGAWRDFLTEESPYAAVSPQILLPEQVSDFTSLVAKRSGIPSLMAAVLGDAVECFWKQLGSTNRQDLRLAREAEAWFLSENDSSLFSFVNICTVLGLDPDYIRTRLKRRRRSSLTSTRWSARPLVRRRQPLRLAP
jgi:hypothetical protein